MKKKNAIAKNPKVALAKNPRRNVLGRGKGGSMSEYRDVLPFAAGGGVAGAIIGHLVKGDQSTEESLKSGSAKKGLVYGTLGAAVIGLGLVWWRHV